MSSGGEYTLNPWPEETLRSHRWWSSSWLPPEVDSSFPISGIPFLSGFVRAHNIYEDIHLIEAIFIWGHFRASFIWMDDLCLCIIRVWNEPVKNRIFVHIKPKKPPPDLQCSLFCFIRTHVDEYSCRMYWHITVYFSGEPQGVMPSSPFRRGLRRAAEELRSW